MTSLRPGIVDIGDALYTRVRLEAAIGAGANYALVNAGQVNSTNGATLASNVATLVATSNGGTPANATVVVNNGPTVTVTGGTSTSSGTATNADLYYCPTGSPPSWVWGSSVSSNTTACTSGGTGGRFVTIVVSYNYTPFFASYGFVTGNSITVGTMVQTQ